MEKVRITQTMIDTLVKAAAKRLEKARIIYNDKPFKRIPGKINTWFKKYNKETVNLEDLFAEFNEKFSPQYLTIPHRLRDTPIVDIPNTYNTERYTELTDNYEVFKACLAPKTFRELEKIFNASEKERRRLKREAKLKGLELLTEEQKQDIENKKQRSKAYQKRRKEEAKIKEDRVFGVSKTRVRKDRHRVTIKLANGDIACMIVRVPKRHPNKEGFIENYVKQKCGGVVVPNCINFDDTCVSNNATHFNHVHSDEGLKVCSKFIPYYSEENIDFK